MNFFFSIIRKFKQCFGKKSSAAQTSASLKELHDILEEAGMRGRYWLVCGIVLGYIREGALIRWDTNDVDFGLWEEDRQKLADTVPALEARGFKKKYLFTNTFGQITQYSFERKNCKFDFFIHFKIADPPRQRFFLYAPTQRLELEREMPLFSLKTIDFLGCRWLIPAETEEYLTLQYGDWKTPNPDYDYTCDDHVPCNKYRRHWNKKYKWR